MPADTTAAYVSNADSGDIWVYHLDADGTLAPVQRMMIGGQVMPMALDPNRTRLYAARRSDPLEVVSYAIDPRTGELETLGEAALPHSMANLSTDRTGRWWFSASYGGNLLAVGPIDAMGVAQPATQQVATGPHAHAIVVDPGNRHVLATTLGDGRLLQFRFDAATGTLTANDPPFLVPHPGASPRHLVFDRDARHVYLLNELDAPRRCPRLRCRDRYLPHAPDPRHPAARVQWQALGRRPAPDPGRPSPLHQRTQLEHPRGFRRRSENRPARATRPHPDRSRAARVRDHARWTLAGRGRPGLASIERLRLGRRRAAFARVDACRPQSELDRVRHPARLTVGWKYHRRGATSAPWRRDRRPPSKGR